MNHPYTSFWHDTAKFNSTNTESIENKEFDILIIGAGLSGLNTAYLLMNKGFRIGIIDASKIGYGTSGYTTAKISVQHNLIYDYLIDNFGIDTAINYYNANLDGISLYKEIIKSNNINCDFERNDSILFTTDKDNIYNLENEYNAYKKLNIDSELKEDFHLPFPIVAGVVVKNQYKFNPLKYLFSIAEILEKNNIKIYENVRAIDIISDKKPYEVITDKGHIFADKIIVSSHYPFDRTLGLFFLKLYAEKSYVIACKTSVKKFEGMYLSIDKTVRSLRYQRYNNQDILLVGGGNHKVGAVEDEGLYYKELEEYITRYFSKYEILSKWSTQDCMSFDKIPFIGNIDRSHKGIYVASGYNKWGMTSSVVAANIISESIINNTEKYDSIFSPNRSVNTNLSSVKEFGESSGNVVIGLVKRFLVYSKDEISNLNYGEGTIINHNMTKLGVYLDENGVFHCIKPICTHLGCEVKFNEAEKTWDCRCHGSRFDIYGHIIQGPATISLKYYSINRAELLNG